MQTMQTIIFDMSQLLRKIKLQHFVIPQFQRDFIWTGAQTKLLIDSIARNYPISSLLLLGKSYNFPLSFRHLISSGLNGTYPGNDLSPDAYYILDGQQRLTSIARVFLDANPNAQYYFDLKKMYDAFFSGSAEKIEWIRTRLRPRRLPGDTSFRSRSEREDNNRMLRADIAINQIQSDVYISEYFEDSGDFPQFYGDRALAREASAKLKGVFENIRKYQVPFIVVDNSTELGSICRIFETINSTGTRLTTFDLAVAKYYPNPDLKTLKSDALVSFPVLSEFEINGERILEILAMDKLIVKGKFPDATRHDNLNLETSYINEKWFRASESLAAAYSWAQSQGATSTSKPPHGIIVSIATVLFSFPNAFRDHHFANVVKKWYFCSILARNPVPQTNYKVGDDFKMLREFLEYGKSVTFPEVYFDESALISIRHKIDTRYGAIQSLMKTTARDDLLTGLPLSSTTEDHHIFPASLDKSGFEKHKLDSVVNRIVLSKVINRDLRNKNPSLYLGELVQKHRDQGTTGELNRRFLNSFIPYSAEDPDFITKMSNENFEGFLENRARMLISRIKEVVGDAWREYSECAEDIDDVELNVD